MDPMKIEYIPDSLLQSDQERVARFANHCGTVDNKAIVTPVVRLPDVDAIIGEAVWAMTNYLFFAKFHTHEISQTEVDRAQAFLASPTVTDHLARLDLRQREETHGTEQ